MKRTILVVAGIALLLTSALAAWTTRDFLKELSKSPNQYSATLSDYGIDRANLYIQGYSGNTFSYYIKDGRLYLGRLYSPKFEIWSTEATIDSILASSDPQSALSYALRNNLVRMRAMNIADVFTLNSAKTALMASAGIRPADLPGVYIQNQVGGICGPVTYTTAPIAHTVSFISQCGQGLVCFNGYCLRESSVPQPQQPGKKRAGEKCNHGGECASTHCVKSPYSGSYGSYDPATFLCSCEEYRLVTTGC